MPDRIAMHVARGFTTGSTVIAGKAQLLVVFIVDGPDGKPFRLGFMLPADQAKPLAMEIQMAAMDTPASTLHTGGDDLGPGLRGNGGGAVSDRRLLGVGDEAPGGEAGRSDGTAADRP